MSSNEVSPAKVYRESEIVGCLFGVLKCRQQRIGHDGLPKVSSILVGKRKEELLKELGTGGIAWRRVKERER